MTGERYARRGRNDPLARERKVRLRWPAMRRGFCAAIARGHARSPWPFRPPRGTGLEAVQALRLHRPGRVPLPVAERPVHQARPVLGHGPAPQPEPASMPKNKDGKPINPRDMNRADGFSPGSMLITKVPGLDDRRGSGEARSCRRSATSRRSLAKRSPVVVINARTRQAPPGLGRDRLEPGEPGRPRADHPAGQELQGGRALHRGAAQPEATRAARRCRPTATSASIATGSPAAGGSWSAGASTSSSCSPACARPVSGAATST